MAAPVNVVIPAGPAPDNPIFVDANDAVVTGLPWLPWELAAAMGGLPRVSIKLSEALAAFAVKCKLSRTPADMVAMSPIGRTAQTAQTAPNGSVGASRPTTRPHRTRPQRVTGTPPSLAAPARAPRANRSPSSGTTDPLPTPRKRNGL